jgi:hypothetical protein
MLAHRHMCSPIQRRNQRGAVAMITVLFLLIVVGFAVLVSLDMSGSDVSDSTSQHSSVQALFLAESGLERTVERYSSPVACGAGLMAGQIPFGSGTFEVYLSGGRCVAHIRGRVGTVARTIQAEITRDGATIVFDASSQQASTAATSSLSWSHTVGTGSNRILIVGVSLEDEGRSVSGITRDGQALTPAGAVEINRARVEIWYRIAPNSGTATITVSLSGNTEVVGGAVSLSGVNQSQNLAAQFNGAINNSSSNPSVIINTPVNNTWVVDTLAFHSRASPGTSATVGPGQTSRWNLRTGFGNGEVTGAGSTEGPVNPAGNVTMSWTLRRNIVGTPLDARSWALGAVYVRPSPQVVRWSEVIN